MSEKKKDIQLTSDQIPPEGALGLLALGDVGVKLWREARKKKMNDKISQKEENEQKESK